MRRTQFGLSFGRVGFALELEGADFVALEVGEVSRLGDIAGINERFAPMFGTLRNRI